MSSENTNKQKASKLKLGIILGSSIIVVLGVVLFFIFMQKNSVVGKYEVIRVNNEVHKTDKSALDDYELVINCRNNKSAKINAKDIDLKYVDEVKKVDVSNIEEEDNKDSIAYIPYEFLKNMSITTKKLVCDEDALKKYYDSLSIFSAENMIEPKNATVKEQNGEYVVVKEEIGSKIDKDKLYKLVEKYIKKGEKASIDVEKSECYINPEFTSTSEKVQNAKKDLEKFSKVNITYNVRNNVEKLDASTIKTWLRVDDKANVSIDDNSATNYVQSLANKYDEVKYTRIFNTTNRGKLEFNGAPYGWQINVSSEVSQLFQAIRNGQDVTREPVYSLKGTSGDDNGIGNDYVEIDLTNQHLWCYVNSALVTEADIVSGDASGRYSKDENYETPSGLYHIYYKTTDTVLTGPGYASPVKYWMPFNGGIGLHDAPWRKPDEFGGEIYKTPGKGGSHGCINIPTDAVAKIYENAYPGMPVICYR